MSLTYVLITPARNEAAFLELTLKSMVAQTLRPLRWVIVSDGSTDGTDALVERYLPDHPWIELVKLPPRTTRDFAAKVHAFNAGLARVASLPYDLIGNIDGDISFGPGFFAHLVAQFGKVERLGVAGTHYIEGDFHSFRDSYINENHVNGQCQLFSRACFSEIGGYQPIAGGGIDWVAVTTARMLGWTTRSFEGETFTHHRKMGTAQTSELGARLHYGRKDYFLGGHPLWQICRGVFQMVRKPYVVGGLALLYGYFSCWLVQRRRPVSAELMRFHRGEQLARLRQLFRNRLHVERQS